MSRIWTLPSKIRAPCRLNLIRLAHRMPPRVHSLQNSPRSGQNPAHRPPWNLVISHQANQSYELYLNVANCPTEILVGAHVGHDPMSHVINRGFPNNAAMLKRPCGLRPQDTSGDPKSWSIGIPEQ